MSLYYRDPDDNGVELAIDNVEKSKWHDWMRNTLKDVLIGAPIDPEELVRKYHAGVPEAEIRKCCAVWWSSGVKQSLRRNKFRPTVSIRALAFETFASRDPGRKTESRRSDCDVIRCQQSVGAGRDRAPHTDARGIAG
jgi:hypothetical protein